MEATHCDAAKTLIVLGSGGHTAEMVALVSALDPARFRPRLYVAAAGDPLSGERALRADGGPPAEATVRTVPRSRRVGQGWLSSVLTSLVALVAAVRLVFVERPRVVLVNGPGTCVPVCLAALLMKVVLLASGLHSVRGERVPRALSVPQRTDPVPPGR
ncbi:UDP-N-acetylglucosamine transferase subunit ALG14 homolog [Pollicipes pollicipes]|uniref:UDP-N-acetylglucosamine transferase subunit ALG14 homolog n=1 Tax=Pollicipes pollicipes TaxID=41117 RepID=UPI00188548D5|nr:UDP-N-acetylglucosamine transferase subunit ALG14 homolog [Pollicipes pollicipes]XP_037078072.1 UDP-N-acetylglucosamine transferase subunit ALG14 homolog [Pollicipes pollicipes]